MTVMLWVKVVVWTLNCTEKQAMGRERRWYASNCRIPADPGYDPLPTATATKSASNGSVSDGSWIRQIISRVWDMTVLLKVTMLPEIYNCYLLNHKQNPLLQGLVLSQHSRKTPSVVWQLCLRGSSFVTCKMPQINKTNKTMWHRESALALSRK